MRLFSQALTLCLLVFGLLSCGEPADNLANAPAVATPVHTKLSQYQLFRDMSAVGGELEPVRGVPYQLKTPLFSDYAKKFRVLHLPEGTSAEYDEREVFHFPVGTIISKTFSFPADLRKPDEQVRRVETRLLIHQPKGWFAVSYVWNPEQTEAEVAYGGKIEKTRLIDTRGEELEFNYAVPSRNQCISCHHLYQDVEVNGRTQRKQTIQPIGPRARHLNATYDYGNGPVNQIEHLAERGLLHGLPFFGSHPEIADYSDESAGVDARARAYLDANCGHCHNSQNSAGINSKLLLDIHEGDLSNLGVCKQPGSAGKGGGGLRHDIVPGKPEESILYFRTASTDPGAMMPQLGRSLAHREGVQLLYDWIAQMPAKDCP